MPQIIAYYNIFIACPSDILEEKELVKNIIKDWNIAHKGMNIQLDSVSWDTHSRPEMGNHPQTIIDKQLVDNCDLLIAFFGNRLGSHTEKEVSGTVEEINKFLEAGKPVMVYFSNIPISPSTLDVAQFQDLKNYKEEIRQNKGLLFDYGSINELKDLLNRHITPTVIALNKKEFENNEGKSYSEEMQQPPFEFLYKRLTFFHQKIDIEFDLNDYNPEPFRFTISMIKPSFQSSYSDEEKLYHLFEEIQKELWDIAAWLNDDKVENIKHNVHSLITKIKGFNRSLKQGEFRIHHLGYGQRPFEYDLDKLAEERKEILDQLQSIISNLHKVING